MDFITNFDICLEKNVYYAGETIVGCVILETSGPIKLRGIKVFLRGRGRVQWKVLKSGESRVLKDDQYLLDDKIVVLGKDKNEEPDASLVLPRGQHQFSFNFQLPQSQLPCSLETKAGSIRYYLKVIIDIPYASTPQGIKYFTLIGPHIDCMDEKYLASLSGQDHKVQCFRCCQRGIVAVRIILERTAYCCGENIKLRAHIENRQDFTICLCIRLFQHIEYRIDRGGGTVGEVKTCTSTVLEYHSPTISENTQGKFDSSQVDHPIKIPVVPPTMIGICRLMQNYYILKICVEDERKNESLEMDFPLTIATIPYRSAQSQVYSVGYDFCVDYVESGKYISPEFRMGHVYDGDAKTNGGNGGDIEEDVILYRPVYVKVVDKAASGPKNNPNNGSSLTAGKANSTKEGKSATTIEGSLKEVSNSSSITDKLLGVEEFSHPTEAQNSTAETEKPKNGRGGEGGGEATLNEKS